MTVEITAKNDPPVLYAATFSGAVENSPGGTQVGQVVASDEEDGESGVVNFRISTVQTTFEISYTGLLTVASGASIDFESRAMYELDVSAEDSQGATASCKVSARVRASEIARGPR